MSGRLHGVGVGPGDPDLLTRRAVAVLAGVDVVAHFAARGRSGNSLRTVADLLRPDQTIERLEYPVTTEAVSPDRYRTALDEFHDTSAARLADHLDAGRDVAVISEGDPMFYGSWMHLHLRLADRYPTEVVPGVTSFSAAAAAAGTPLVSGTEPVTVVAGTLPVAGIAAAVSGDHAVVILKVGRNLPTVTEALRAAGRLDEAVYVERASFPDQRVLPVAEVAGPAPYFSLVLVPGRRLAASRAVAV